MGLTPFHILSILFVSVAFGGYINRRFLHLPATIGHMAFALLFSLVSVVLSETGLIDLNLATDVTNQINFSDVLLHGMLAFLLFAGAMQISVDDLKSVKTAVAVLATLGVVIATFIVGGLVWYASGWVGVQIPYIYALLFGALISPTDPIAVLSILKQAGTSKTLYAKIGGESLFNDGVAVVVFLAVLGVATGSAPQTAGGIAVTLLREMIGGGVLGFVLGYITYLLLSTIDDYKVEVLLTLALASGGYTLAEAIHVSAPICMVVAGLIVGHHGRRWAMSEETRHHLYLFWELLDEILNAILFLLVGLQIVTITITADYLALGLLTVVAVLLGRFISVILPFSVMSLRRNFERGTVLLMTWGGLRGGISIAMALSLPPGPEKSVLLPVTYIVVLFSIFVQGLTFKKLVRLLAKRVA